jgi:hypothetical protein
MVGEGSPQIKPSWKSTLLKDGIVRDDLKETQLENKPLQNFRKGVTAGKLGKEQAAVVVHPIKRARETEELTADMSLKGVGPGLEGPEKYTLAQGMSLLAQKQQPEPSLRAR